MAVYGNSINKFDLISNIYEQNLVFESIDITLNEGVGDVLKNIFKGLIKGIKAVIKWIKDFIINILNKLKRNKNINNTKKDNIQKNMNRDNTQNTRTDEDFDNRSKFIKEKNEFLDTPILDIVKTNPYDIRVASKYNMISKTLKNIIKSFFSNGHYEFNSCSQDEIYKNGGYGYVILNGQIDASRLYDYEFFCDISKDNENGDSYFSTISIIFISKPPYLNDFESLNIDDIVKIEKSLKNTVKVFEDIIKLLESADKLYKENNMDELNKLFDKFYELQDKIEIPGYKNELKNDVKSYDDRDYEIDLKIKNISDSIKRALMCTKNNILILSKFIPLYYKLKNDIDTLENYANTNKERIMKKYNITDWKRNI